MEPKTSLLKASVNKYMIHFTKYAENKFEILNKYKVYFTRETIEDVVLRPDKIKKTGKNLFYQKDDIMVVLKKEKDILKIITFYPIKN